METVDNRTFKQKVHLKRVETIHSVLTVDIRYLEKILSLKRRTDMRRRNSIIKIEKAKETLTI